MTALDEYLTELEAIRAFDARTAPGFADAAARGSTLDRQCSGCGSAECGRADWAQWARLAGSGRDDCGPEPTQADEDMRALLAANGLSVIRCCVSCSHFDRADTQQPAERRTSNPQDVLADLAQRADLSSRRNLR